jgi:hypothetical protein
MSTGYVCVSIYECMSTGYMCVSIYVCMFTGYVCVSICVCMSTGYSVGNQRVEEGIQVVVCLICLVLIQPLSF